MRTLRERWSPQETVSIEALAAQARVMARPLRDEQDLDPLLEQIGEAKYVLLGEASHGTSEYYTWRAKISKRLIEEKGFSFLAVEGDWPDCYQVNRYAKGYDDAGSSAWAVLHQFQRWPTWMWANREIVSLVEWLRQHNQAQPNDRKVGFYGLDVYSLWDSLHAVIRYLERSDGSAIPAAKQAYRCFEPYGEDAQRYAWATASFVPTTCEAEAIAMLTALRREVPAFPNDGHEAAFVAEQNALIVQNAERYYRAMVRGGPDSWNVRDNHMVETLNRLMRLHGPKAKAIVWEHNTHIGDARATDMARRQMVNVGQLAREQHTSEGVWLIGFGSHHGTVIAGTEWEAPMQKMNVPPAREGSWEDVLHRSCAGDCLFLLHEATEREDFLAERGHRAIGVVYDPDYEYFGNYVPTVLPRRYDAFLYLEETKALHPLHIESEDAGEPPETYPWNV